MAKPQLLVGDIGGTNARFAVAEPGGAVRDVEILAVAEHESFDAALRQYLKGLGERPAAFSVASAGIRRGDTVHLTNAPWSLGESALCTEFGFEQVCIFNDFEAQARFAGTLKDQGCLILKEGTPIEGAPVLTVGPGTGFGQAVYLPGNPGRVAATEGGHRLMPVRDARELRLFERVSEEQGYPAILEEALSGRGIVNFYRVLIDDRGEVARCATPPEITSAALDAPGTERDAVLWFLDMLACAAADACFSTGARGGVVISGGITPRLVPLLKAFDFASAFARPGVLHDYLAQVPVRLVTEPHAALYGAASLMHDRAGH
ncbi:MAG: glucokinase [Pseudomonadota bacterium]